MSFCQGQGIPKFKCRKPNPKGVVLGGGALGDGDGMIPQDGRCPYEGDLRDLLPLTPGEDTGSLLGSAPDIL